MLTPIDDIFLRRALRLAMNGRGHVEPNPTVGCVLVKDGAIIGEGWHAKVGEAHAEPNALDDCAARGNDPRGATAYVTLEPCCHANKRTPPCAPRLIEANVARAVIGCLDPNPDVNGRGAAMLWHAGMEVDLVPDETTPDFEPLGWPAVGHRTLTASVFQQLIAPFARRMNQWNTVILKWAETADGKVSGPGGARLQISNAWTSKIVHQLRSRCDAIAVGINTVLADDPLLTPRGVETLRVPVRCVLDRDLRIPVTSQLVRTACRTPVTVFTSHERVETPAADALRALGVTVTGVDSAERGLALFGVFQFGELTGDEMTHVLVEPGPTLARSMMDGFADVIWTIRSGHVRGGATAVAAPIIPTHFAMSAQATFDGDVLTEYRNARAQDFHAAVPSADFILASETAKPS